MGMIAKKTEENKTLASSTKPKDMKDYIAMYSGEIEKALPKVGITPERFTRLCLSAVSTTPKLAECTPKSFLGAMMTCAQMGIEPNTPLGQAYLIPYKNYKTDTTECQFQLGYKGLIELAHRSGQVQSIFAEAVHENDVFEYELGIDAKLTHKPCLKGPRGDVTCYYAVWKGKDGGYGFSVMSVDDIQKHRQLYSKAKNSPWDNGNFDEMAKKTVMKRALKYAPLSIDLQREVAADETVKSTIGSDMLDEPNEVIVGEGVIGDADDSEFIGQEPEFIDPETGEIGG